MKHGERCLTHDLWEETGRRIEDFLASVSLADVLNGRLLAERGASKARHATQANRPLAASVAGAPG